MRVYILMGGYVDDWNFYGAYMNRKDAEVVMDGLLDIDGFMAEITDTILQ